MHRSLSAVALLRAVAACLACLACTKPSPPTVVPERASVTSFDMVAVHLDVAMTAANPNSVDLPVRDVTARVTVAGRFDLGTTTIAKGVTLPAGKSTEIEVPVVVKWTDMAGLAELAASAAAIPFTVDGTVDLGGDLLAVSVPFHIAGTVSHDQLVDGAINSLPGFAR